MERLSHNKDLTCISLKKADRYIEENEDIISAILTADSINKNDNGTIFNLVLTDDSIVRLNVTDSDRYKEYVDEYISYMSSTREENMRYYFLSSQEGESLYFVSLRNADVMKPNGYFVYTSRDSPFETDGYSGDEESDSDERVVRNERTSVSNSDEGTSDNNNNSDDTIDELLSKL